ncbi:hypothetical protein Tco_0706672, partial [Tanacetum coccineum]
MNNTTPNPYSAVDPNLIGVLQIGYQEQDTVISDSEDSTVTYTVVSSPFADLPDIGSPKVDGPPVMPEDPSMWMRLLQLWSSHTVLFTYYDLQAMLLCLNHEEIGGRINDETIRRDPADYPADGGDDGDDEDESDDDEDEEVDIEADDEEEEEHPAPADSIAVALPAIDQAPSAEETESFETDESAATPPPHPAYRVTARISIRDETPISLPPRPLPVSPSLPQISSPPLPVSSPIPVLSPSLPASPICPLGYQAVMIRLRAEAASTSHSLPLPPPIILPSKSIALGPRYEVGERLSAAAARPAGGLRADYGFVATMDREIRHDLERDVRYGIIDSWDEIVEAMYVVPT